MDDELIEELMVWASKMVSAVVSDPSAREDVVQEVMIEMWQRAAGFDSSRSPSLIAFLKQRGRWQMAQTLKGERYFGSRHRGALNSVSTYPTDDPGILETYTQDADASLTYHHAEIREAIGQLAPQQQRYVYYRFELGYSGSEMAEVFGYVPNALWTHAKKKLAVSLAHLRG